MLKKFTSVLLGTIGIGNQLQARTLSFGFFTLPAEVDPRIYTFVRRVVMFLRFLTKYPNKMTNVGLIFQAYRRQHYVGYTTRLPTLQVCYQPLYLAMKIGTHGTLRPYHLDLLAFYYKMYIRCARQST